jgi:hypothetical protein
VSIGSELCSSSCFLFISSSLFSFVLLVQLQLLILSFFVLPRCCLSLFFLLFFLLLLILLFIFLFFVVSCFFFPFLFSASTFNLFSSSNLFFLSSSATLALHSSCILPPCWELPLLLKITSSYVFSLHGSLLPPRFQIHNSTCTCSFDSVLDDFQGVMPMEPFLTEVKRG